MDFEKLKRIEVLYLKLPKINCKKLCINSCGPIGMSQLEYENLKMTSHKPEISCNQDMTCGVLKNGLCGAYEARPMICRLFGLVETMKCPFGCVPDRWISKSESFALLKAMEQIGGESVLIAPSILN